MRMLHVLRRACILRWLGKTLSLVESFSICGSRKHVRSVRLAESANDSEPEGESFKVEDLLPEAEIEDFLLLPHRPLGMTVEESLADSRLVLVTKVVEGVNANQAGIEVGDVVV